MVSRHRDIVTAGRWRRSLPLAAPPACRLFDFAHGFS